MRKSLLFLINNIITNQLLIVIRRDDLIKKYKANWSKTKLNDEKTLQENVGFSHEKEVQKAIDIVHESVQKAYSKYIGDSGSVLDIGCGVGLYLKDFPAGTKLHGTDLSSDFILKASELLPQAYLRTGNFMDLDFRIKFEMIFSISVLQYIPPSSLQNFFNKTFGDLSENGILMIQYPHALSKKDCLYPDLSYVAYSPQKVEGHLTKAGFEVLEHSHSYDGRNLNFKFDKKQYDPDKEKSFRNGAVIIGRKN